MALRLPRHPVKFFLHIPRTGGTARQTALEDEDVQHHPEGTCYFAGHGRYLSSVRPEDSPIIFVRDPVDRFVSAWDHIWRKNHIIYDWATIEELALDLPNAEPKISKRIPNFMPMVRWFDAEHPELFVGRTENMAEDLDLFMGRHVELPPITHPTANASKPRTEGLSPEAEEAVRRYYADDIALLQALAGVFI